MLATTEGILQMIPATMTVEVLVSTVGGLLCLLSALQAILVNPAIALHVDQ